MMLLQGGPTFLLLLCFFKEVLLSTTTPSGTPSSSISFQGLDSSCIATSILNCFGDIKPIYDAKPTGDIKPTESEEWRSVAGLLRGIFQRPESCHDLWKAGDRKSGVRRIFLERPAYVYCDQETDGGGWIVIQRRTNETGGPREDFFREWAEYVLGFGDLKKEMWAGLQLIHDLTRSRLQEIRIDLEDYEGEKRHARYSYFMVEGGESNYRLRLGKYSGDAGDSFSSHEGMAFSARDEDHDTYEGNCAQNHKGGWWYGRCHSSNLNGLPHEKEHKSYADGINWRDWKEYHYSLRRTTMRIRDAFPADTN